MNSETTELGTNSSQLFETNTSNQTSAEVELTTIQPETFEPLKNDLKSNETVISNKTTGEQKSNTIQEPNKKVITEHKTNENVAEFVTMSEATEANEKDENKESLFVTSNSSKAFKSNLSDDYNQESDTTLKPEESSEAFVKLKFHPVYYRTKSSAGPDIEK